MHLLWPRPPPLVSKRAASHVCHVAVPSGSVQAGRPCRHPSGHCTRSCHCCPEALPRSGSKARAVSSLSEAHAGKKASSLQLLNGETPRASLKTERQSPNTKSTDRMPSQLSQRRLGLLGVNNICFGHPFFRARDALSSKPVTPSGQSLDRRQGS